MKHRPLPMAVLLLAVLLLIVLSFFNSNAAGELAGAKICLDPGHGGTDPGAVNAAYDLNESDINLDVSFGLKLLLEREGADVVMTRSGDEYLTNEDRYTFCNDQQATILISVHTNSVTDPTWDGAMALYAPNRDPYLAQAIYDVMYPFLGDTAPAGVAEFRDFGLDHFASGVLFKCDMPAAMMEPLLMSHPAEAELLTTPLLANQAAGIINNDCAEFSCRRGQIAKAIYLGTVAYSDNQAPDTAHVAAIDMDYTQKQSTYFVNTIVTIHDSAYDPVFGAEVSVRTTQPDGTQNEATAVTENDGTAGFRARVKSTGTFEAAVIDVSKTDWLYDQLANVETIETLEIP